MKNSRTRGRGSFQEWIASSWFNVITLLVAVLALWVAWSSNQTAADANKLAQQANQIMLRTNEIESESSSPNLRAIASLFAGATFMETGCRYSRDDGSYEIGYYLADEFTIANTGGRNASLVKVDLERSDGRIYTTKVFPPTSFDFNVEPPRETYRGTVFANGRQAVVPTSAEPVRLPVDLEAGSAESWFVQAQYTEYPASQEEAKTAIAAFEAAPTQTITWTLSFSDGSIVTIPKSPVIYSPNPNLFINPPLCNG